MLDSIQKLDTASVEVSAFSSTAIRDAACAHIQEEIASHEAAIRSLRQRHNELSMISRLPPELISTVFKYVADSSCHSESGIFLNKLFPSLSWIGITHVFSQWRRVALNCPNLWSDIPLYHLAWSKEMLTRSKMAPLKIMVAFSQSGQAAYCKAAKAALMQLSRVRELSIIRCDLNCHRHTQLFMEIIRLLNTPAPLLETFIVRFEDASDQNRLPDDPFSGDAPRLKHLKITNCGLNWQAPILSNLRSLCVECTEANSLIRPPDDQFLFALCNMRQLESLNISCDIASTSGAVVPRTMVANLSRLVDLTVDAHIRDCVFLLDHIIYPTTTRVNVLCDIHEFKEDPVTNYPLIQVLAEELVKRVQKPIRSVYIGHWQSIKLWTLPDIIPCNSPVAPELDFIILPRRRNSMMEITGLQIFHMTPSWQQLGTLEILDADFHSTLWLKHFGGLDQLKDIRITIGCSGFLEALCAGTSAALHPSDPAIGLKFKALRNLTVQNWVFDKAISPDRSESCIETLKNCLKARLQEGVGLFKLVLEYSTHVQEDDVAELKKFVENVEWVS